MLLNCGVGEDSESPLDCKEIKPVNAEGNQSWRFIGRSDAEAETPLWPPDVKSQLIRKNPDAGKVWRQEEKEMTEDKMVGWHHWLNGHESEQAPGDGEGQGTLACCSPWGCKESDTTERLSNNSRILTFIFVYSIPNYIVFGEGLTPKSGTLREWGCFQKCKYSESKKIEQNSFASFLRNNWRMCSPKTKVQLKMSWRVHNCVVGEVKAMRIWVLPSTVRFQINSHLQNWQIKEIKINYLL